MRSKERGAQVSAEGKGCEERGAQQGKGCASVGSKERDVRSKEGCVQVLHALDAVGYRLLLLSSSPITQVLTLAPFYRLLQPNQSNARSCAPYHPRLNTDGTAGRIN